MKLVVHHPWVLFTLANTKQPTSTRPIHVVAMLDAYDDDLAWVLAYAVQHSIRTATRRPDAYKVSSQLLADTVGLVHQGARNELDHGTSDCLGQLITQCSTSRRGEHQLVLDFILVLLATQRRRRRIASTPRRTSPRA